MAGIKYKGMSLEGEYYRRWLTNFTGSDIRWHRRYHRQWIPVAVFRDGHSEETPGVSQRVADLRATTVTRRTCGLGANWYFLKERGLRLNAELIHLNKSPVGYTAVPYPVGGNGNVFHVNLEMNF